MSTENEYFFEYSHIFEYFGGCEMKKICLSVTVLFLALSAVLFGEGVKRRRVSSLPVSGDFIKWVDFSVSRNALSDALALDTETYDSENHRRFTEILAYVSAKNYGEYKKYKTSSVTSLADTSEDLRTLSGNEKLFDYYEKAYSAALGGAVGSYTRVTTDESGNVSETEEYGLRLFSPIAAGYYYNDYADFGDSRSYGYKREHLGHDMLGSVGTPIIAVESGRVEALGWNNFGGWRIGIRSFDGKRYYYYAHLRKDHPFCDMYEGKIVNAGEVIGYLGMTGYSRRENTNNINIPHLHFGLELIFDPSQKDSNSEIWIDVYALTQFLAKNRSEVVLCDKEKRAKTVFVYPETPD